MGNCGALRPKSPSLAMSNLTLPRWAYATLAALAVAVAGFGYVSVAGPRVDVVEARPMPLRQTVVVSGRVLTPATVEIGATITGRVGRILVDEGRHVGAGELLIELEHDELAAALKAAEAQEAAARNRISQWRETGLPGAQQTLVQAEENYRVQQRAAERSAQLFAQGFIGQAALDEARRSETVAKSQLETARANLASVQQTGAEYRLLEDQLRAAAATRETAAAKLAQTMIRAPAAGTVLTRSVEQGDIVQPGKVLLTLAQDGDTRLIALVDEKNLAVLREGQPATVSADAFPAQRFGAVLTYVSPGVDVQRGTVETKFRVPQPPPFLRADMTVSIEIEVADRADAIVVPLSAVRDAASQAPWILVVRDGVAERQPVRIGARTAGAAEIVEGVAPGALVVVGGAAEPGRRVRTHAI
jgi:HlyD family secretion protein